MRVNHAASGSLLVLALAVPLAALSNSRAADESCETCGSDTSSISILEKQIRKVACDTEKLAEKIRTGEEQVPPKLYHYGRKQHMLENAAARTVPKAAWDTFIMGSKTRFPLNPVRRGLYATAGLDKNGYGAETDWLMEVEIKDECRAPRHVATLRNLHLDPRFKEWAAGKDIESKASSCYSGFLPDHTGFPEGSDCEKITLDFFKAKNIRIVHDHLIDKSFYIRDRDCIANVRATPDDVVEILLQDKFLWESLCGWGHVSLEAMQNLLFRSLAEVKTKVAGEKLLPLKEELRYGHEKCLDAFLRCDKAGQRDSYRKFITKQSTGRLRCEKASKLCR